MLMLQWSFEMGAFDKIMEFLLINVNLIFAVFLCTSAVSVPCPHGTYGEDCRRHCHCLSGPAFCRSLDGKCTDNKCSFGWTKPPYCQTECPAGTFGLDCSLLCHCKPHDLCSNVNGLCMSGMCGYGWGGASCQRALPVLYDPPTISRVNGDQLIIRWLEWISGVTGNGSGSVVGYKLQALTQFPTANWQDIHILPRIGSLLSDVERRFTQNEQQIGLPVTYESVTSRHSQLHPSTMPHVFSQSQVLPRSESSSIPSLFSFVTANLLPNTAYKFRVVLIGLYLDKPESSWPGPATPLWTTTACGCGSWPSRLQQLQQVNDEVNEAVSTPLAKLVPSDPPSSVQIAVTDESSISVLWKPPAMETVRCHGIARHDVTVTFSEPSCRDVMLPVLWPINDVRITKCSSISSVAVRVVGDTGNKGPWSSEFLLHTDLSLKEKVMTSYPQWLTWTAMKDTFSHASTTSIQSKLTPDAMNQSTSNRHDSEQAPQNQSTTNIIVRLSIGQVLQKESTAPSTVRQNDQQTLQNRSTTIVTERQSIEQVLRKESTTGTLVRQSNEQKNPSSVGVTAKQIGANTTEPIFLSRIMTRTTTNDYGSVIAELLNDACTIDIVKRSEHSLIVKLTTVNQQVTFESCCLWIIDFATNESKHQFEQSRPRPEGFAKMFNYRLVPATFYRVTVTARLIISSQTFSHTFSLILSTSPPLPAMPPTPVVTDIGDGRLRVQLTPVTKRPRRERSPANVESVILVIVERNAPLVGPSVLEKTLMRGHGKRSDSRSNDPVQDILMNLANAALTDTQHYVAGLIKTSSNEFVIGEGESLPDPSVSLYSNPPVGQGQRYLVWLAAENRIDGVAHRSYSRSLQPIYVSRYSSNVSWWFWIPILIVVVILILIAVIVAIVVCTKKFSFRTREALLNDGSSRLRSCQMSFPPAVSDDIDARRLQPRLSKRMRSSTKLSTLSKLSSPPTQLVGEYSFAEPRLVYESDVSMKSPIRTSPIVIGDLREYCEQYLWVDSSKLLGDEFACLPCGFTNSVSIATKPTNTVMNRTLGSIPYDQNRIRPSSGDYVNASLVRTIGWRRFVVTQYPISSTVSQFWNIVWEQNITKIVALMQLSDTNGELYWPEMIERVRVYDDVQVEVVSVVEQAHYVVREFLIERIDASPGYRRRVVQWQYTWWPSNKGFDTASSNHPIDFLNFVKLTRNSDNTRRQSVSSLTLVHCVTGGGRSGLYLSVDALIDQGRHSGMVDVLKCVSLLRTERSSLVSSLRQYRFIYECLCEEFDHPLTRYSVDRFLSVFAHGLDLDAEYSLVFAPLYFASSRCNHNAAGPCISRNSTLKSSLRLQVSFGKHHADKEDGDCNRFEVDMHPVIITDGFIDRHSFIVYQCPNSFEADSFWNVVVNNRVMCIVALCCVQTDISNSHLMIPRVVGEMNTISRYSIKNHAVHTHSDSSFTTYALSVSTRSDGEVVDQRTVHVFELTSWSSTTTVPRAGNLVQLVDQVRGWRQHNCPSRPVLVFGAAEPCVGRKDRTRAAVFCTLWTMIEQAEKTNVVDVFASTRLMCSQLPSAVISKEYYSLLYAALIKHLTVHRPGINSESLTDITFQYSTRCHDNRDRLVKNISKNHEGTIEASCSEETL